MKVTIQSRIGPRWLLAVIKAVAVPIALGVHLALVCPAGAARQGHTWWMALTGLWATTCRTSTLRGRNTCLTGDFLQQVTEALSGMETPIGRAGTFGRSRFLILHSCRWL